MNRVDGAAIVTIVVSAMFRGKWAIVGLTLGLAIVLASPAQAALPLGQINPPGSPLGCSTGQVIVQTSAASGNDYRVPPGGGVITEWSARSWTKGSPDQFLQLVLAGSDVNDDKATFAGLSAFERIVSTSEFAIHSFKTRIPVSGGERLGLYGQSGGAFTYTCAYGFVGGPANRIIFGTIPQPTVGAPPVLIPSQVLGERIPVEAMLEADADKDGFGDETQDQCPSRAATQVPCPIPDTLITKRPKAKTKSNKATFVFSSTVPGAAFECRLDRGLFRPCVPPRQLKVAKGKHKFEVRSSANEQLDASPAVFRWKVEKKPS